MNWIDAKTGRALGNDRYRGMAFGWIFRVSIGILAIIVWWWRPLPVEAPGKFGAVLIIALVAIAWFCSTRPRATPDASEAPIPGQTSLIDR